MNSKAVGSIRPPQSPGARGLKGIKRFVLYAALQLAIFTFPPVALAAAGLLIIGLGYYEGLAWGAWLRRSWPALLIALGPALATLPFKELALGSAMTLLWPLWMPGLMRSARFFLVLCSASWLSFGMSPVELRDLLAVLLRPLGARIGGGIARAAALMLAFLPWTMAELKRADEAARLRGSDPAKRPISHLAALSAPLALRTLEKARRSAEALSLRDAGMGGGQPYEDLTFDAGSAKPV